MRREAVAAHHNWVFPDDLGARSDLAHGNHPSGQRAPNLQAVDGVDVVALGQGRTNNDRQQPRLLRKNSRAGAAWLSVESDRAAFKAALQGLGHFDAGNAVAACLEFEQIGADDHFLLSPIVAYADRAAIIFKNLIA